MSNEQIKDHMDYPSTHAGPVVMVNVFTPKPGQLDNFIAAQIAEYKRLRGDVAGWRGNRLHKSLDGRTAVNIATFDSLEHYRAWRDSDLFADHFERIRDLVEQAEPGFYEIVYDAGTL